MRTMLSLLNRRIAAWSFSVCLMTSISANAGLLPERVEKAAQERIAAGTYHTLVFGVVDGDKSEVVAFGELDNGKAPIRPGATATRQQPHDFGQRGTDLRRPGEAALFGRSQPPSA